MTDMALVPIEPKQITIIDRLRRWAMPMPKTSPARIPDNGISVPQMGNGLLTLVNQRSGYVAKANALTYRAWSESSPWVRAAIDILRDAVASAEWDIVQVRPDGPESVRVRRRLMELIEQPNPRDDFWAFIQMLVEDICVLDAGATEKVRYPTGELAELWPVPGEQILVNARWDGSNPDETRFVFAPDGTVRATFRNDDFIYGMQNPRSSSAVGLSPLEVLKRTVDAELRSTEYNARMVTGAPPAGVLDIGENAMPQDVARTKAEWESDILGQDAFAIIGGFKAPKWMAFRNTNQEMQYREWLDYLVRQIAVVYGLSPMDLGITFDVNRSTADAQMENSEGRGVRPLMSMLQRLITRHVVHDESFGGKANNLQFVFTALNLKESKVRAEINKIAMGGTPWKAVNEARVMDGRPPIGSLADETNRFNHILALTPKGMMDVTIGEYVGEQELAQIAAEAQMDVEGAKAEARAANPTQTQTADMGGKD